MAAAQTVRITGSSSRIEVIATERDDVEFTGDAVRTDQDGVVELRTSGRVVVRVPLDTDIAIGTRSGRVTTTGRLGATRIVSESGAVIVDEATEVDVRTTSSRIDVGRVGGTACARSSSGQISIGRCSGAIVSTESGRIEISRADRRVDAHCVSGRITITMEAAADVDAETVSGAIRVRYPSGVRVAHLARADGSPAHVPPDTDCAVRTRTVSGRVEVSNR